MCTHSPCRCYCTHEQLKETGIIGIVLQPQVAWIILSHTMSDAGRERGQNAFSKRAVEDLDFTDAIRQSCFPLFAAFVSNL